MISVIFVMGPTGAGKSTVVGNADVYTQLNDNIIGLSYRSFHAVEVGKEFRKRYPPEYFDGKAAMPHTEDEAFSIFQEQFIKAIDHHTNMCQINPDYESVILVDGYPRTPLQVDRCQDLVTWHTDCYGVVWLDCDEQEREQRLNYRDIDESTRELSRKRFESDYGYYMRVVARFVENMQTPDTIAPLPIIVDSLISPDTLYLFKRVCKWQKKIHQHLKSVLVS